MPQQPLRPENGRALVIPHHDPASRVGVVAPGVLHVLGGASAIEDRLIVDLLDAERHLTAHPLHDPAHLPWALVTATTVSAGSTIVCTHDMSDQRWNR